MTDVSQGPGWWIASDGKWYPPHLHPSVAEMPPPPSYVPPHARAAQRAWDLQPTGAPSWTSPSPYASYPPGYGPPGYAPVQVKQGLPRGTISIIVGASLLGLGAILAVTGGIIIGAGGGIGAAVVITVGASFGVGGLITLIVGLVQRYA